MTPKVEGEKNSVVKKNGRKKKTLRENLLRKKEVVGSWCFPRFRI